MKNQVAWIDNIHELSVIGDVKKLLGQNHYPTIYWEAKEIYIQTKVEQVIDEKMIKIRFHEELPMGENLYLYWGDTKIPIFPGSIVRTNWFDEKYANLDTELGAICDRSQTTFSVWAPTAVSVDLILNDQIYPLKKHERGIWKLLIEGDWHGYPYEFQITVNGQTRCVNDPYAKSMLPNSEKGIIVDLSRTKQLSGETNSRPKMEHLQDSIIYELHVRDATIHKDSGVKSKGKFIGLTEKNTKTDNNFTTALSYIKELGVTHVQLLPINDFARVDELHPDGSYNWGYDPLYFQALEGSYSRFPEDPIARINECKLMIETFHQEELSVILDVVYNHVFIMEESTFEKMVPGYYFRYHPDGTLSNGTGVGNDFASERKMARKFILDTVDFWLREYQVDGFRFDLLGSLDIDTMTQIAERCKKESTPIMLLGEGWDLPTALTTHQKATNTNSHMLKDIHFFNDFFRDTIKGSLFHHDDTGFINGDGHFKERLPHLLSGCVLEEFGIPFVSEVSQTINYVECHDNHTLWDRLLLTNPRATELDRKKMHQLATGLTLLSQGVPFLHAGQEWYRTKQGVENSYISKDEINQLDWGKRELETENIRFVKQLISLRKKYEVFRLKTKNEIRRRFYVLETPKPVIGITLLGDEADFSVYANPTKKSYTLQLPSPGQWKIAVTNIKKKEYSLIIGEYASIDPYELMVVQKSRKKIGRMVEANFIGNAEK